MWKVQIMRYIHFKGVFFSPLLLIVAFCLFNHAPLYSLHCVIKRVHLPFRSPAIPTVTDPSRSSPPGSVLTHQNCPLIKSLARAVTCLIGWVPFFLHVDTGPGSVDQMGSGDSQNGSRSESFETRALIENKVGFLFGSFDKSDLMFQ